MTQIGFSVDSFNQLVFKTPFGTHLKLIIGTRVHLIAFSIIKTKLHL